MVGGGGGVVGGGMVGGGGIVGGGGGGVVGGGGAIGGGAGQGGSVGCMACGCETAAGPAVMSFVGGGAGAYTQETTYKYVGMGAGEFDVVTPKKINMTCVLIGGGIGLLLLVILLLLLLLPGATTTTTPMTTALPFNCNTFDNPDMWSVSKKAYCCEETGKGCPKPPTTALPFNCNTRDNPEMWTAAKKAYCCTHGGKGCGKICTLWGDPHVISFDQVGTDKNQALSFYGDGDFWVVKSSTVHIQGRFQGTKYTEGLAATNQIVVGGPFLKGHKIEVGTRDSGVLTVDGQPVMSTFPSSYHGAGFTLTYDAQGEVPDVIPEGNEKRIVHMELPLGVKVRVYQWNNYVDVEIEMSPQPQQDGVCGNFNGNHADDTTQSVT